MVFRSTVVTHACAGLSDWDARTRRPKTIPAGSWPRWAKTNIPAKHLPDQRQGLSGATQTIKEVCTVAHLE
jgi:hypothetical protein